MSLNSGETLQPFKALNQLIFDSSGNLIGIQNDRAVGNDLRIGGGSGVDGTFATLIATTALKLNSGATFDLYNTADQTTNYERLRAQWTSNIAEIVTQYAGTGTTRSARFGIAAGGGMITGVSVSETAMSLSSLTNQSSGTFVNVTAPWSNSSGTSTILSIAPTFNQSGTAGYTALDINPIETATGSGTKLLQRWAVAGTTRALLRNDGNFAVSGGLFSGYLAFGGTPTSLSGDVVIVRDGANVLALQNSTNAQTFRVYNTYTDASNYRRWNLSWNTKTAIMQVVGAGTGTNGNLAVGNAALATTDTVGYFMIPSSAGAPTGVPADIPTGQVALHFDSTNNKLYVYDGGWLSTAALT